MTSKLSVKRIITSFTQQFQKQQRHTVDLLVSNWLRQFQKTWNSNSKKWLLPFDLITLISKYQIYNCIFDVYDKKRFIISNKKTQTLIKTTHNDFSPTTIKLTPTTIISSKHFMNGNSVDIKIARKLINGYKWFLFSIGFVAKYCKLLSYQTEISHQSYGFRYYISILDDIITLENGHSREDNINCCVKLNDIISMKIQNDAFQWRLNGEILFKKDLREQFNKGTNLYFAISYNSWTNVKLLVIK